MNTDALFRKVVTQGLAHASADDVARLAEAFWYDDFVPALDTLTESARRDACYLVDRLLRYNIVDKNRKQQLLRIISVWRVSQSVPEQNSALHDQLAAFWRASADLSAFHEVLMPLQTRQTARLRQAM